ncbi:MAG: hypothetical protein ACYTHK_13870 [Planctomycetota bacterium]
MILLLRHDAPDELIADLRKQLDELGFESTRLDDVRGKALEAHGEHVDELLALSDHPAVQELLANEATRSVDEPLWPHGVLQISILLVLLLALLLVLIAVAPAGLGGRAELGAVPPEHASEWYVRPLAAFLRTIPAPLGGIALLLLWLGLVFWPFVDRGRGGAQTSRRSRLLIRIMGVLFILTMLGFALLPQP